MSEEAVSFAPGDEVTWTRFQQCGLGRLDIATKYGKIVSLDPPIAHVKLRNGHKRRIHLARLRKAGQITELTEMFLGKPDNKL